MRRSTGFTLVEMLVSMALSMIILGVMLALTVRTIRFKSHTEHLVLQARRAAGILSLIRRDLEGAYRDAPTPFMVNTVGDELKFWTATDSRFPDDWSKEIGSPSHEILHVKYHFNQGNLYRVPTRSDLDERPADDSDRRYLVARELHGFQVEILNPEQALPYIQSAPPRLVRVTLEMYFDPRVDANGDNFISQQERYDAWPVKDTNDDGTISDAERAAALLSALRLGLLRRFSELIALPAGGAP